MKRILWFVFIYGFLNQTNIAQTNISGVINHYAKVTVLDTICQIKLTVDDTTGFSVGMKAILIQMKGATIDESNSTAFGTITDMGGAGWYEKNEIDSIGEDCVFLKFKLSHSYEIAGKIQLVSMPNFENAIIMDTLTADPWNGDKGGILAFSVENELSLNENIDVSGKGFRGGNSVSILPNNCSWLNQQTDYYYDLNNWRGALKGEGIAELIFSKEAGKGPQATGGGGGNDHNAGGGGGSNASPGGKGGINDEPSLFGCKGNHPGLGGTLILDDFERIFFGGGGGAGHGNNDVGTNGGNGGGIVIIEAGSFTGNSFQIKANGLTPPDGGGDGAGGGGSGGTLVVNINTINDLMSFEVKGGNGGLIDNSGAERCHGPGGGGSGGRLLINQGLGAWNVIFDGGEAGLSINSGSCPVSSNGALAGADGNYFLFYELVESDIEQEGPLNIINQTLSQEVCAGEQALFIVSINGNPTNYQWQVDEGNGFQDITDGVVYSGTMTDSLTILNPGTQMSGWIFQCIISNACDEIISEAATLEVTETASITDQPESVTVCEGGSAEFSVTVSGSNILYQWQADDGSGFQDITDGLEYSGTMTETLTILNPSQMMSGWLFQCLITTDCGDLISEAVTLEVTESASITNQPESVTVCEGGSAEFSVTVSGSNIQYQWQADDGSGFQDITDGSEYSGTMTETLTVLNPTQMMSGWLFQCVITTDCGDLISEAATLEVTESASITNQPESITVCEGGSAEFSVTVSGSNIQYQWQADDGSGFQDITDGLEYSGTMTETLTVLNPTQMMSGWLFQCVITTDCGDLISEAATLEVTEYASITDQPESVTVCEGGSAEFSVTVSGSNILYQWQADDGSGFQDITDGLEYSGTMTETLTVLNPTQMMSGWLFQCVITTDCGDLISEAATLEVTESASITNQPESVAVCEGGSAEFSVTVSGSNIQYQWQVDDGSGFQDITDGSEYSGTMTETLTVLNPTQMMSGWLFQCVITTDCGDLNSEAATLEVTESASITNQPESVTVCEGVSTEFSIIVSGSNIQYQWQVDVGSGFQNINDGGIYFGTMTDTLTILNPLFFMSGWIFQCLISTDCGDLISNTATFEIIVAPFVSIHPESILVCEDSSVTFKVNVSSSNSQYEYQWQVDEGSGFYNLSDNAIYSNTNTATLGISMASFAMDGYIYRCIVTYDCGTITSGEAQLFIEIAPIAQFDFIVNGSLVDFNNLSSFNSSSYIWEFGDNSSSSQVDPSHNYSQSGVYLVQLIAINNCGSDTIVQEVGISFLETPEAAFSLNNGTGCAPLLVQFSDESTGAIDSWTWSFPGGNPNNSTDQNPQVIYETSGSFDVTLEVSNAAGNNVITYEDYIFVDLPIFASYTYTVNSNEVAFTNTTQNATTFQWNFGDNTPESTEENPVHEFVQPGVYNVTLVATNPLCGSAITKAVDVLFTGTKKMSGEGVIEVFPNPVDDVLTINFVKNNGLKTIQLFHINGQKILEKQTDSRDYLEIDLSDKLSGMYILKVVIGNQIFIENIVKL